MKKFPKQSNIDVSKFFKGILFFNVTTVAGYILVWKPLTNTGEQGFNDRYKLKQYCPLCLDVFYSIWVKLKPDLDRATLEKKDLARWTRENKV